MIAGSVLNEMACNTDTVCITAQRSLNPPLSCSFLGVYMQIMQFTDRAYAVNENETRLKESHAEEADDVFIVIGVEEMLQPCKQVQETGLPV